MNIFFVFILMIGGVIGFIFFIMVSIQRENAARDAFFNEHISLLKNSNPKLRRKTVRALIDSLGMQQRQNYSNAIGKLLLDAMADDDWQIRYDVLCAFDTYFYESSKRAKDTVISRYLKPQVMDTYISSFTDSNPFVRVAAIKAFTKLYQPDFLNGFVKGDSYLSQEQFGRTVPELVNALNDDDEKVCAAAAGALKFSGVFDAILPLLQALHGQSLVVQKKAIDSLQALQKLIRRIQFGQQSNVEIMSKTLLNPDISEQCVPFLELREVEIHTDSCDLALVERFSRYLQTAYKPELLHKQICVTIYDDPLVFSPETSAVFGRCRSIDLMLETVAFGDPECLPSPYPHSLTNPDFTPLTLPCNHLRRVLIDTEHADFHLLERLLTYMLAYLGQAYLKDVDVTLYGDPTRLHPNLHNNIRNLFPHVTVYEATQLIGVTAEQKQQ